MSVTEKYEVFLRISDSSEDQHLFLVEHWFVDRPEVETVKLLLDEAKRDFSVLYPDAQPDDFSVEIRRLRPHDTQRAPAASTV